MIPVPFRYSRKKLVLKKDAEGNPIPLIEKLITHKEDGTETVEEKVIPGRFETEEKWATDYINLGLFIRTHELENGNIIVLLQDGHEVTEKVPVLKNPKKPATRDNISEEKQRQWVQSEILLEKEEDIEKLYQMLDNIGSID